MTRYDCHGGRSYFPSCASLELPVDFKQPVELKTYTTILRGIKLMLQMPGICPGGRGDEERSLYVPYI